MIRIFVLLKSRPTISVQKNLARSTEDGNEPRGWTLTNDGISSSNMKRHFPKPRDLRPLVQFRAHEYNARKRRLDRALTISDLREIAKRRVPRAPFDYVDGGAGEELSLSRNRQAFRDIEFHPSVLRDVSNVNPSTKVLGGTASLPFGIAPTGFTRMMHTEGECAGASAAGEMGIPFSLSTMGTTTIENVKSANPRGRNWFQLYIWKDRDRSSALIERAATSKFDALMVTVDVPVAGDRNRDQRNGLSVPPRITIPTFLNATTKPEWWFNFLTTDPLAFATLDRWPGTVAELLDSMFDPTVTYEDLVWIRSQWRGNLIVKGVQTLDDAKRLTTLGVDAIVLSNHGGRQLDRATTPFHLLPEVAREVGKEIEVHIDSGIMSGVDIVAAIALGAKFTFVGRAYLYGLMAGGKEGVIRSIEILSSEIIRTMQLLGVTSIEELQPQHITQYRNRC